MKDEDIIDIEAAGFSSLKWEAAEKMDIKTALKMQKMETETLCRLIRMLYQVDPEESADWWK